MVANKANWVGLRGNPLLPPTFHAHKHKHISTHDHAHIHTHTLAHTHTHTNRCTRSHNYTHTRTNSHLDEQEDGVHDGLLVLKAPLFSQHV